MDLLVALGHLIGALVALSLLSFVTFIFRAQRNEKNYQKLIAEVAVKLGIRTNQVKTLEWDAEVAKALQEKFSEDRLNNRLADFFGVVALVWNWLVIIVMVGSFIAISWLTLVHDLGAAVAAWGLIVIWVLANIVGGISIFLCKLLTGRHPGHPASTRAGLQKVARTGE